MSKLDDIVNRLIDVSLAGVINSPHNHILISKRPSSTIIELEAFLAFLDECYELHAEYFRADRPFQTGSELLWDMYAHGNPLAEDVPVFDSTRLITSDLSLGRASLILNKWTERVIGYSRDMYIDQVMQEVGPGELAELTDRANEISESGPGTDRPSVNITEQNAKEAMMIYVGFLNGLAQSFMRY